MNARQRMIVAVVGIVVAGIAAVAVFGDVGSDDDSTLLYVQPYHGPGHALCGELEYVNRRGIAIRNSGGFEGRSLRGQLVVPVESCPPPRPPPDLP